MNPTPVSRGRRWDPKRRPIDNGILKLVWRAILLLLLATPTGVSAAQAYSPEIPHDPSPSQTPSWFGAPTDIEPEKIGDTLEDRWQLLRPDVITYVIQPGDNDWSIARRFGLDIDTLRFSNEWMRRNPDLIHPGKELVILPVIGAYHTVQTGDTVESIGRRYGVPAADIVDFPLNNLTTTSYLVPGQRLIVPGGRLDYAERILPPGSGRGYPLAWPVRGTVSQGYRSGHLALDVASVYGAKVYASAGGRVVYARFSPGGWLGFTVTIVHDNGLKTRYSHLAGIYVEEGQWVSRGQVLGTMGSTGNSTGPHVHFEVFDGDDKANPWNYLPPDSSQ